MKANAPEKIYLPNTPVLSISNLNKRTSEDDIEYTRTDAFIEKASWWIEENIKKWYENIKVHGFIGMTPLMITEFKNYMEVE